MAPAGPKHPTTGEVLKPLECDIDFKELATRYLINRRALVCLKLTVEVHSESLREFRNSTIRKHGSNSFFVTHDWFEGLLDSMLENSAGDDADLKVATVNSSLNELSKQGAREIGYSLGVLVRDKLTCKAAFAAWLDLYPSMRTLKEMDADNKYLQFESLIMTIALALKREMFWLKWMWRFILVSLLLLVAFCQSKSLSKSPTSAHPTHFSNTY